jgi:hypothetical protein
MFYFKLDHFDNKQQKDIYNDGLLVWMFYFKLDHFDNKQQQ